MTKDGRDSKKIAKHISSSSSTSSDAPMDAPLPYYASGEGGLPNIPKPNFIQPPPVNINDQSE